MRRLRLMDKDVQKFAERLKDEERSENTIEKYTRDLRKLITFLDGRELSKELMIEFKQHLMKKHQPAGVNSILAAIKTFLRYNGLERFAVKRMKCQRKIFCPEEREMTRAEYKRLVRAAEVSGQTQLSVIMQTICSTGIRVSELAFFTVEAVKKGRIEVTNKGKTRVIFIPKQLKKVLEWYCKKNGIYHGVIFVSKNGKCVSRRSVWEGMKKICRAAGVEASKVFPHNLRKVFARVYYSIKHDITKLADILGHSSIETTRTYLISTGHEHEIDINQMNLVLGVSYVVHRTALRI